MKPQLYKISRILPDQSVVCLVGKEELPEWLSLSDTEREYALGRLRLKEDLTIINSYKKVTYIVRIDEKGPGYKKKEELRKAAYNLKTTIRSNNHEELVIAGWQAFAGSVEAFAEGLILSIYSFEKYKTKKEKEDSQKYPVRLLLYDDITDKDIKWLVDVTDAVYMARNLVNEPVNHLNAPAFAEEIRRAGNVAGFSVEVMNKGKIEALKMGGLIAVNKGSVDPPVFCVLEWRPENPLNEKPVILVGKGVVYDTGGLNLKPGDYMDNMKGDMSGGAAVTGVLYILAKTNLPVHVIGLVPATDNRPGGNAYVQGDILTMYNKMTVEVGNTDAEGRLILADAISYASKYKPELIIDIATLTGSAAMTFGIHATAVMGNAERKWFELLAEAGNDVYERTAELPFWEEYGEMIKSDLADVKNVGPREAGAITAGKFLERFAEYPLIHLDIAGPGLLKKDDFYRTKDGPGSGVRLLSAFLKKYAEQSKA